MATQNKVNNSLGTTAYAVMCGGTSATNPVQPVASVGTSGEVLMSNGAGALPSFQSIPGNGALVQIGSTQTASNSTTINFTSGIDTTYDTYLFVISDVIPQGGTSTSLWLRFSDDGGSSYISTNYQSGRITFLYNNATAFNDNLTSAMEIAGGISSSTRGACGFIWLYGLATSNQPTAYSNVYINTGSLTAAARSITKNTTTSGVDAIRFLMANGNIGSGSFTLFGLRK